jgi:hypothetical protein
LCHEPRLLVGLQPDVILTGGPLQLDARSGPPSGADELFTPYQPVQLPNTGTLAAFDISFVKPKLRTLRLRLQGL